MSAKLRRMCSEMWADITPGTSGLFMQDWKPPNFDPVLTPIFWFCQQALGVAAYTNSIPTTVSHVFSNGSLKACKALDGQQGPDRRINCDQHCGEKRPRVQLLSMSDHVPPCNGL